MLFIFISVIFVVDRLVMIAPTAQALDYTQFYRAVEGNRVADVTIRGQHVTGHLKSASPQQRAFETTIATASDVLPALRTHDVDVTIETGTGGSVAGIFIQFVPIALMALLLLFILRQAQKGRR